LVSEQITIMKIKMKYSDTKKEDKQQLINTVKFLLDFSETSSIPTIRVVTEML